MLIHDTSRASGLHAQQKNLLVKGPLPSARLLSGQSILGKKALPRHGLRQPNESLAATAAISPALETSSRGRSKSQQDRARAVPFSDEIMGLGALLQSQHM